MELLEKEVFKIINPKNIPANIYIFNLQFIDKIKNTGMNKVFTKSYLVTQSYNDLNKDLLLIQLPIIQWVY